MLMTRLGILLLLAIVCAQAPASAQTITLSVKYVSPELVYLDGGRVAGIATGDTLGVLRGDVQIARIVITFAADYSAAGQVIEQKFKPEKGDITRITKHHVARDAGATAAPSKERAAPPRRLERSRTAESMPTRATGNIVMQWYHSRDGSPAGYRYNRPGARINLKVRNLLAPHYNLEIRARSRLNDRSYRLHSGIPMREWQNRIYTLAFSYDDQQASRSFRIGRILTNALSGMGYIDGLMLQQRLSQTIHAGIMAGTPPHWQNARFQTALHKYGLYLQVLGGSGSNRYTGTLGAAGEYHGATVSRELIYVQNAVNSRHWDLFQSAEIDLNRDWRKNEASGSLELSNLYLNLNFRLLERLSAGLSLDDRKNYLTWEIRSLADSLFDDAMRYGVRANVNLRIGSSWNTFVNAGLRQRETDSEGTYSFAAGLQNRRLSRLNLNLGLHAAGFFNNVSDGYYGSIQLGKSFSRGEEFGLELGNYSYSAARGSSRRSNQWLRVHGTLPLSAAFFLQTQYEYDLGDDMPGQRFMAEIGCRF